MINIERKGEKSADHLYEVHLTLPKVSKLFSEMKASPFFVCSRKDEKVTREKHSYDINSFA